MKAFRKIIVAGISISLVGLLLGGIFSKALPRLSFYGLGIFGGIAMLASWLTRNSFPKLGRLEHQHLRTIDFSDQVVVAFDLHHRASPATVGNSCGSYEATANFRRAGSEILTETITFIRKDSQPSRRAKKIEVICESGSIFVGTSSLWNKLSVSEMEKAIRNADYHLFERDGCLLRLPDGAGVFTILLKQDDKGFIAELKCHLTPPPEAE